MLLKIKRLLENNPIALATTNNNKPNVIGVAYAKVVSETEILITDNYMKQTLEDLKKNNNVCLVVWDKNFSGYKLIGKAKYYKSGKWKVFVENMKENKGLPSKGAILMEVLKIIKSC